MMLMYLLFYVCSDKKDILYRCNKALTVWLVAEEKVKVFLLSIISWVLVKIFSQLDIVGFLRYQMEKGAKREKYSQS